MGIEIKEELICNLCGMSLQNEKEIYSFPAFVANAKDPMFYFNDQSFHLECLKSANGRKAIELSEKCLASIKPMNRICEVDGKLIILQEDYLFIPLLTSNEKDPLFKFNYLTFNRKNLNKWIKRNEFVYLAKKFASDDFWQDSSEYPFLDNLIKEMSQF